MPAEQWLNERGWTQLTLPAVIPDSTPLISPDELADEIAVMTW